MENFRKIKVGDKTLIHYDNLSKYLKHDVIEEKYNAKYVGEVSIKTSLGNWLNLPVALFYTETKHPEGSHYFGMFFNNNNQCLITNGLSAVKNKDGSLVNYLAVTDEDNNCLYSAYRHDYQTYNDLIIDGGREYFKGSLHSTKVFNIEDGKFVEKCLDIF